MVVMNTGKEEKTIDPQRFSERLKGFSGLEEISDNIVRDTNQKWKVPAHTIWIMKSL
jgi:hypothetical protein